MNWFKKKSPSLPTQSYLQSQLAAQNQHTQHINAHQAAAQQHLNSLNSSGNYFNVNSSTYQQWKYSEPYISLEILNDLSKNIRELPETEAIADAISSLIKKQVNIDVIPMYSFPLKDILEEVYNMRVAQFNKAVQDVISD